MDALHTFAYSRPHATCQSMISISKYSPIFMYILVNLCIYFIGTDDWSAAYRQLKVDQLSCFRFLADQCNLGSFYIPTQNWKPSIMYEQYYFMIINGELPSSITPSVHPSVKPLKQLKILHPSYFALHFPDWTWIL